MVFFNYNGNKIFYEIKKAESKKFLIFIHGSGSSSSIWRYQFDIDDHYTLIALDLPSHSRSDTFKTLSLELYVNVLQKFIESLKMNYDKFLKDLPIGAFSRKTPTDIINEYVKETSSIGSEVTYQDFSICDKFDTMNLTSTIKIPIIVITGKEDKLTPVKYANYFKEKVTNSKLYIIEKAGHMVMIEQPHQFNEIIKENIDS